MNELANLLTKFLNKEKHREKYILYFLIQQWPIIFGEIVAKHSQPQKMDGNVLFVNTDSSAWSNNLLMMKAQLIKKINQAMPCINNKKHIMRVSNIIFFHGRIKEVFPDREDKKDSLPIIPLSKEEILQAQKNLPAVKNSDLNKLFARLVNKDAEHKKNLLLREHNSCKTCGVPIPEDEEYCLACSLEKKAAERAEIAAVIRSAPWITFNECINLKKCDRIEYSSVKDNLTEIALSKAIEDNAGNEEKIFAVMLLKGLGPEEITMPLVEQTIADYKAAVQKGMEKKRKKRNVFTPGE